jgi:prophage DNA circulation protein
VIYRQADADPNVKVRNEDVYIVVGKTIVVRGGIHYAERIQLARISLEMKGTATLKSSLDSDSFGGNQVGGKNSVVSPASINQSAFGVAFSNGLKVVSSVSGALNAVAQTVTSLASVVSQLSTPSGAIAAAARLVLSGSPDAAAALSAVATQATAVLNTVNQAQNAYNSITGSVGAIAGQLSNLPKSVSVAALSQPNGVTSALSSVVRTLSVLSATSSTVSYLANALPIDKKTTESGRLLSANASAISSTLAGTANTASNLWNTAVSIVSGKSIPRDLSPAGNAAGADVFNRLALLVATGGATAQTYQRLIAEGKSPQETLQILSLLAVQAEMLKSQTSPIWMTAGNFVKTFDTPQQSAEYIESATKYT